MVLLLLGAAACHGGAEPAPEMPLPAGVVFTYPVDGQRDVPLGAHLLISFSDALASEASRGASVIGPDGAVAIDVDVLSVGRTLRLTPEALEPATTYAVHVGPSGEFAPASGAPLFRFTTSNDRPRAGPPALVAINGSDPAAPGTFRPILDTSTLQLVFSEPLDPRSVALEPGAIELVAASTGAAVPLTLVASGARVALDPVGPLSPGDAYELRLGPGLVDLGGEPLVPTTIALTPLDSIGRGAIPQVFRTRQPGDPVAEIARTNAINVMDIVHPLIGATTSSVHPSVLETELGDPLALGGPIAFAIPKGQRLSSTGLDVALAGVIPSGLSTGDIVIELLTDGGGRLYRNPHLPDARPDNERAPLSVDLSLDIGVFTTDATGNAVLAQTVLGVQLSGVAMADEGALVIETVGALDIDLLGISSAPANIVLDLISAPDARGAADERAPVLVTTRPERGSRELSPGSVIELVLDEPIDIDRARSGGIELAGPGGVVVPVLHEIHGSVVVLRPRAPLTSDTVYSVELRDVADRAGNVMPSASFALGTLAVPPTDVPPSVVVVSPGAPCALVEASASTPGRCEGGAPGDDRYRPFELAANERLSVVFDQRILAATATLGAACDTGSVRVERVDASDACVEPVAGTLIVRESEIAFVPDRAWQPGERYRLRLVSGPDATCEDGDLCGANGRPANFDRLAGAGAGNGGGPDLVARFVGGAATTGTTMMVAASPQADLNGSGHVESGEGPVEQNRVALRMVGTSGLITEASFEGQDCIPETAESEACMYVLGAIPARLGDPRESCALPDGTTAPACIPVAMSAQAMYSTSMSMRATAVLISLTAHTGMSVLRIREPADGPLEGYIVERDGRPVMIVALDLYLDAPDMSLPVGEHDMRSKPLSVLLEGPLSFLPDGRIAITLSNADEVPITVTIDAPLGLEGTVDLVVPPGEMRLKLLSRSRHGGMP